MKTHIIKTARQTRNGWNKVFCDMAENKDDKLLDTDAVVTSEWDKNEWEWKTSLSTKIVD